MILTSMATPRLRGTTSKSSKSDVSAEVAFPERILVRVNHPPRSIIEHDRR